MTTGMMLTNDQIRSKISGRDQAKVVLDLLGEDSDDLIFMASFINELKHQTMPPQLEPKKKKLESFVRLSSLIMPFGIHEGLRVDQVPTDYLEWLIQEQENFYTDLRAYMTHPENMR